MDDVSIDMIFDITVIHISCGQTSNHTKYFASYYLITTECARDPWDEMAAHSTILSTCTYNQENY